MLPEIPLKFVYLGPDGEEHLDKEFEALCVSVPRVGEVVVPQARSERVMVDKVYHKFIKNEAMSDTQFVQYITVVLKEAAA